MQVRTQLISGLEAHASGSLWIPETQTAIIADLHLGYSWAQRRRGELGPLADENARAKLYRFYDEMRPREIVFLGDLVHAPHPCAPERAWIEQTLAELARKTRIVAVRGNHDRAFAREFGHLPLQRVESWSSGSVTAAHGDRLSRTAVPEHGLLVAGHLHPSLAIRDASGACHKIPVFLVSNGFLILPAFSPFAGGYDVGCGLPAEFLARHRGTEIQAFAATGSRIVSLGPLNEAIRRMQDASTNKPSQFRRRGAS